MGLNAYLHINRSLIELIKINNIKGKLHYQSLSAIAINVLCFDTCQQN